MSDANQNPNEGDVKVSDVDMTKFVPKEEYDKVVSGKTSELASLQKSLEEAQGYLTNPQYLQFLARSKAENQYIAPESSRASSSLSPEIAKRIENLEATSNQLAAIIELHEVEREYPDFNDYRSDVHTLITSGGSNLTFKQAYLIAKSNRSSSMPDVSDAKAKKDAPKVGTEKPGKFIPDSSSTDRVFKNATEASNAALSSVKEKYGITGDII